MNRAVIFLTFIFLAACAMPTAESQKAPENPQSQIPNPQSKQLVLVELYTSEGCSSCPAADRALAFLEREQPVPQAEIVALALHVDYWNRLGWKDEFSSALFSQRQEYYSAKFRLDSVYTPQMIVDGNWEFTGSNTGKAVQTITEAAKAPKASVEIAKSADKISVKISNVPAHERATVYLAVAEDNLKTAVGAGENKGKNLEHSAVVRELKSIGMIEPAANSFETEIASAVNPAWKRENLKLIVFVQDNASRRILGINRIKSE